MPGVPSSEMNSADPERAEPEAGGVPPPRLGEAALFVERLERVATTDATVLLEGEHGSGKGTAARELHRRSPRRDGPFVEVGLPALSPTLVEAALFGHEEGAFTGAHKARRGYFSRAGGGTLVLDAVETLPEDLQVKLLRVLQERCVEPLGGEPEAIDVRFVATSSVDLRREVEAGRFREDLYFRLAVVTLRVPPLRARLDELPELVARLVPRIAERNRVSPRELGVEALERLARHSWPGNLRELENALERVLVLPPPGASKVSALELEFLAEPIEDDLARLAREALALGASTAAVELAMIEAAIEEQRGNLSAAARQLGLSRRALEYRRHRAAGEGEAEG